MPPSQPPVPAIGTGCHEGTIHPLEGGLCSNYRGEAFYAPPPASADQLRQAGLKLECANGYLNSRAGLVFVDSSKHDQFADAQEQQQFARDEFLALLHEATGLTEIELRRILS